MGTLAVVPAGRREELADGQLAELAQGLDDRRQRRREIGALVQPVEPDDGDVVRHRDAARPAHAWSAPSAIWSLADEQAVDVGCHVEQRVERGRRRWPTTSRPRRRVRARSRRRARARRASPAWRSRASCQASGPARWPIRRRPSASEVRRRQPRPAVVVDDDRREVRRRLGLEEDDRRRGRPAAGRGSDARFWPRSGAAKMMPSTRWADQEVDDRARSSTCRSLSISLSRSAIARRLGLLGDAVERLGDAEVAQARRR